MEKGLYLSDIWIPEREVEGYDYIYYGSELCINKFLHMSNLDRVINYCIKYNKTFCFMTPFVPENSFEEFVFLFENVCKSNVKKEIIVNDFGIMQMINENYKDKLELTYGRLLNRMKKSPSIMNYFNKFNEDSKMALQTSAVNNQYTFELLQRYGYRNIQYENVLQSNRLHFEPHFNNHLLLPCVQVSTSRKCIGTCVNSNTYYLNGVCDYGCEKKRYTLYNKEIKQEVILNGNTIMYVNNSVANDIRDYSRIVYNKPVQSWEDIKILSGLI